MRRISLDLVEKIIELTKKGWNRPRIARELGIAKSTVYLYQKKYRLL